MAICLYRNIKAGAWALLGVAAAATTAAAQTVPAPAKPPAAGGAAAPGSVGPGAGAPVTATPPPASLPAPAGLPSPTPFPSGLPSPLPFPAGVPSDVITAPGTAPAGSVNAPALPNAPGAAVPLPRPTALEILQSFQRADADRDGSLSRAEAQRLTVAPPGRSFEDLDANKDGVLSRSEYENGLR